VTRRLQDIEATTTYHICDRDVQLITAQLRIRVLIRQDIYSTLHGITCIVLCKNDVYILLTLCNALVFVYVRIEHYSCLTIILLYRALFLLCLQLNRSVSDWSVDWLIDWLRWRDAALTVVAGAWQTVQFCWETSPSTNDRVIFLCSFLLQYFDTVGWVFWPVKTVSHVTYTVLEGT